jgi:hypothetical protein
MTRKSKQAGGNMPLTYYERTKGFASSEYGTTSKRLAGHSQYQLGDCALGITKLSAECVCTPSGYLYEKSPIYEYMLRKTQELKVQQSAFAQQEENSIRKREQDDLINQQQKIQVFEDSQKVVAHEQKKSAQEVAREGLKRTSYWLAESQPEQQGPQAIEKPAERPASPNSQEPLRIKDLWPLSLTWLDDKLVCAISSKPIQGTNVSIMAFWTSKQEPGTLVLTNVYKGLIAKDKKCPETGKTIKYTRSIQTSGSSFSTSSQQVEAKKYRPTIT